MRRFRGLSAAGSMIVAALLLVGCAAPTSSAGGGPLAGTPDTATPRGSIVADLGLEGADVRAVVSALDAMPRADRPEGLVTAIHADEVVLSDEQGRNETLSLPAEELYVSAAPYVTQTHDCYIHSPTSCIGELSDTEVDVIVTDSVSGETVLDETRRTFDNGFVGLWLPRDRELAITVIHDGRTATTMLSTAGDDVQTCVTTLRLA